MSMLQKDASIKGFFQRILGQLEKQRSWEEILANSKVQREGVVEGKKGQVSDPNQTALVPSLIACGTQEAVFWRIILQVNMNNKDKVKTNKEDTK